MEKSVFSQILALMYNCRLLKTLEWFMDDHFDKLPLLETLKTLCTLVSCENNSAIIEDLKVQCGGVKTILSEFHGFMRITKLILF